VFEIMAETQGITIFGRLRIALNYGSDSAVILGYGRIVP
jgi:hypothetical protein